MELIKEQLGYIYMTEEMEIGVINLIDFIHMTTTISCENCFTEQTSTNDKEEFANILYEKGWRSKENGTFCPECLNK